MWLSVGHHRLHRVSKPQRRGKNASAEESGIPQRAVYRVEAMWLGFTLEDARRIPKEWSPDTPSVIVNLKRVLYICQNNKCEEHTPWQDEVLSFCSLPNWLEGLWFNSSGQWIQDVLDVLVTSCYILYIYYIIYICIYYIYIISIYYIYRLYIYIYIYIFFFFDLEKWHAAVARSTFASQHVQNTCVLGHFWSSVSWLVSQLVS